MLAAVEIGLMPLVARPLLGQTPARGGEQPAPQNNYTEAMRAWSADADNPDALFNLGQLYRLGAGVERDLPKAYGYYRRAADKGHIGAQVLLARSLLDKGDGASAAALLKPAAIQGDAEASFLLGSIYVNGDGVPRNVILGQAYLLSADLSGLAEARPQAALVSRGMSAADRAAAKALALSLRASVLGTPSSIATAMTEPAPKLPSASTNAPPRPQASPPSEWQVQLGAYSSLSQAKTSWSKMMGASALLRSRTPRFQSFGEVTRLRIAVGSKDQAGDLCRQLMAQSQPCFAVAPMAAGAR